MHPDDVNWRQLAENRLEDNKGLIAQIEKLEDDLEGVRLICKLQAEEIAEQRHTLRQWLAANAPGGWIDDLRKSSQSDRDAK